MNPVMIIALLFSVIVHECAHGLAALYLGDPTAKRMGRLTLNPLVHIDPVGTIIVPIVMTLLPGGMIFGWAKPVPVNGANFTNPVRDHAIVAAAGPASNLLLSLVLSIALGITAAVSSDPTGFIIQLLQAGVIINVVLAIFNLIPLPPLDGSWIMMSVLKGKALYYYIRLRQFGFPLVMLLLWLGVWDLLSPIIHSLINFYMSVAVSVADML
ncbi:site-2 protease family protein [bacterium]|jgi:Zn-dependent protease|nr:site-2 protease family protein [bacterium]MBT7310836.1 site-2 protease family protein [bacterium]